AFEAADVGQWTGPGQYDFVYCRFLLQHLAQPAGLLRRMWDAARPGGVLAVEDADLEGLFCDPDNAGFSFYQQMYAKVLARNGGDPGCARRLASRGLATADEVTAAIEALRAFTVRPDPVISDPRIFQVWARRGADDAATVS